MRIYIPTRARPHFSTISALPVMYHSRVRVVVQKHEYELYRDVIREKYPRVPDPMVLPKSIDTLAETRQWIIGNADDRIIAMMDDDITSFCTKDDLGKFGGVRSMSQKETSFMLGVMKSYIESGRVCVSTVDRMALARPSKTELTEPSRAGQVMFIDVEKCIDRDYRFDRIAIYHDQDFALQIARDGEICATSNRYGHNMRPLYAKGGLQTYRSQTLIDRCAKKLVSLHGDLVTLRWKERNDMNIPTRSINWKRAYKLGLQEKS